MPFHGWSFVSNQIFKSEHSAGNLTFSVSGYSTTLYAYIGEFNTDRNRTAIISWITVSIGLANIFIPSIFIKILLASR